MGFFSFKYIATCVFALFLCSPQISEAQVTSTAHKITNTVELSSWAYYTTDDNQITPPYIVKEYLLKKFIPYKNTILNAGIPKQYYWIHFSITNIASADSSLIIDIENARLNELELFGMSGNMLQSLGKAGDFYPFSQRSLSHKDFLYPVTILPGQKKEYFLYINQVGHTFTLPVKIYTEKSFSTFTFTDYLFDGVTYGILLFVAVVSFLFFLTSKHYLYLYYCLYIITAILWFLSYFGLGYQYLWGNHPPMNTSMAPAMASLNIGLNLQICQVLLRLAKTGGLINKMANVTKAALLILALFPFGCNLNNYGYAVNHAYLMLFLSAILLAMLIVSFSVFFYSLKGFIEAKLYLAASLLKAGSIVHLAFLELGIAPARYHMEGLLQIGIFIEITLFTYALALRYTSFKTRTFVRVIKAHENERALICKEIHDGISGSLTGINYGMENFVRQAAFLPAEKKMQLEKICAELNKVELEAKNISHNTMPDYIKVNSIAEIIKKYVEKIQYNAINNAGEEKALRINFSTNEQLNTFSEAIKLNIFRMVQEILANILKHSKATNADILFSFSKREVTIIAEDNGTGFNLHGKEINDGMGIKNIRTRVELLDGNLSIKSPVYKENTAQALSQNSTSKSREYGTLIKIKIPYKNNLSKNKTGYDF